VTLSWIEVSFTVNSEIQNIKELVKFGIVYTGEVYTPAYEYYL
jgi:hypothetical protein